MESDGSGGHGGSVNGDDASLGGAAGGDGGPADGGSETAMADVVGADSSSGQDAPSDAGGDAAPSAALLPSNLPSDVCKAQAALDLRITGSVDLFTDTDSRCIVVPQTSGPAICMVRARDVTIAAGATLTIAGARAFALVATGNMDIQGTIDASGRAGGTATSTAGAGTLASCFLFAGGTGAGFGTAGGATTDSTTCDDPGGLAYGGANLIPLIGGSRGGVAGSMTLAGAGAGGQGGGAIELVACDGLTLGSLSVLDVGGAGGGGGYTGTATDANACTNQTGFGGGGGGSGGAILIESRALTVAAGAVIAANGGGGGSGGSTTSQSVSHRGQDGARSAIAALGGAPAAGNFCPDGCRGGSGGVAGTAPAIGLFQQASCREGGGGGGAVGRIRINVRSRSNVSLRARWLVPRPRLVSLQSSDLHAYCLH